MADLTRLYDQNGIAFSSEPPSRYQGLEWLRDPNTFGNQAECVSYLLQLEDEGFIQHDENSAVLSWDTIYKLRTLPEHTASVSLLGLPPIDSITPNLSSSGGLTDLRFSIAISGWRRANGLPVGHQVTTNGAIATVDGTKVLLPELSWCLVREIKTYAALPQSQKGGDLNRHYWGHIRSLAIAAHAGLDHFLTNTVVLTPEKLQLNLRKIEIGRTRVVEVIPEFHGAPSGWLRAFDGYDHVQDHYQIPDGIGLVQILIEPAVKTVLAEIKRMPGRRVAGSRAEAFIRNPFALLGDDANTVISENEFEEAREEAGIYFNRFTTQTVRDDVGICGLTLIIESSHKGVVATESYKFESPDELKEFVREFEDKLSRGMQCCSWQGWDLEFLGDAEDQLRTVRDTFAEWTRPRPQVRLSDVYDLSRYTERIKEIGEEKPYYSPYIARQNEDEGWFPDNVITGFFWTPEGSTEAIGLRLDAKEISRIESDIAKAKAEGNHTLNIPGCPKPIGLQEAESLVASLRAAIVDVNNQAFPKPVESRQSSAEVRRPPTLVLKPNIERIEYTEERRRAALAKESDPAPHLPKALKPDVKLLDHQRKGIAWLQHLWEQSPEFCRGVLLADDMGLGKTLQLLTFIAKCFEVNPRLEPVLIVAPVSLLVNWEEEINKFFMPGHLKIVTLYGDELANKKLRRDEIDGGLVAEGLTKFLRQGWRRDANVILTTYETLRDLEFSLASEHWSIMICDEAQKIKNANALVTRAAKKQNVRFKIACTGTPVENTLADLWCLFDFIQPGLLGALNDFSTKYRRPIEAKTEEEKIRVDELRKLIEAQLIRRTKREVAKDLPQKLIVDSCKSIEISPFQKSLYSRAISQFKSQSSVLGKQKINNHLGLLHYLKRICADPQPIGQLAHSTEAFGDYAVKSPKMRWLIAELKKIRTLNEKAIIFTEYRDIQRLIQSYVQEQFGFPPDIINGDTTASSQCSLNRQKRINIFQDKPGFCVIILSPLAVGFGVNIQAANHVIHYTRMWNPAKEDQATDRAYRIGQTKNVFVYCPTISDPSFKTFDKRLDELLERKRSLSEDMLNGTGELAVNEFGSIDDVDGVPVVQDRSITLDDVVNMDADTFEVLCLVLWKKQGYPIVHLTKKSGDGGVDVVAIKDKDGALIQSKSSQEEGKELGWEAVKDVVAGEAAYKIKHPGVAFTKFSVTNQFFNRDARHQAEVNNVRLVNQGNLLELLQKYSVTLFEIEQYLR